jgi:hypothetical protein
LITINNISFDFINVSLNYTSNISSIKRKDLNNGNFKGICFVQNDYKPSLSINCSVGNISNSMFENSGSGGITIIDSNITISSTQFKNNIINSKKTINYKLYPNLRFNILLDGYSNLIGEKIETDTLKSYFIYNKGKGNINGDSEIISSPLFIQIISNTSSILLLLF